MSGGFYVNILSVIRSVFSLDTLIYLAIFFVFVMAFFRCIVPLWSVSAKLRRAARIIIMENRQNKDKKSWNDLHFLGDKLQSTWTDFLQNAEMRDAHGGSCDVTQYINEDTIIYAASSTRLAELAPGIFTSLGILGTFMGLVMGLSGLTLNAANTQALLAAMEKLIAGMSTAFLTSIAGVIASIVFNLLNTHYTNKCQKAIDRFCEVFGLYAMPKPVSQDSAMLALAQEQSAYIHQSVEQMSQKMAQQIEQGIMRAMLPVQRSMDNFILAATREQVEGVDRIAQVFVQRMNAALGNEFDHLRMVLRENSAEQQRLQQDMRAATEAIAQMTQDVVNMHQLSQGVLEHFRDYVTDMSASRAEADDANRRTLELLEEVSRASAKQAERFASVLERLEKLEKDKAAQLEATAQAEMKDGKSQAAPQEKTSKTGKE